MKSSGFTLMETVAALGISAILIAAIVPYIYALQAAWAYVGQGSDMVQNGRVGLEYMTRELSQIQSITSITPSSDVNGKIVFVNSKGQSVEFSRSTVSGKQWLTLVTGGVSSQLAGPIGNLIFKGKTSDTVTPTTVPARIKAIDVVVEIADAEGKVATQTYNSTVSIRKHIVGAMYYSIVSGADLKLEGIGLVGGNFHANGQTTKSWLVLATGIWTDADSGYSISVPTVDLQAYTETFGTVQSYLGNATVVSTRDMTFLSGQTYVGNYYMSNGKSATIQAGATIVGSIFAEGMVTVNGSGTRITPQSGLPAIVAGGKIVGPTFASGTLQVDGSMVASGDITLTGNQINLTRTSGAGLAVVTPGTLTLNAGIYTIVGGILGRRGVVFSNSDVVTITAADGRPALATEGNWQTSGTAIDIQGLGSVGGNATLLNTITTLNGVWTTGGTFRATQCFFFTYSNSFLGTPPPYFWGE